METPKKPAKKETSAKSPGAKTDETSADLPAKNRVTDDDDDDDFDIPLDDLGRYESFDNYDDDDDF